LEQQFCIFCLIFSDFSYIPPDKNEHRPLSIFYKLKRQSLFPDFSIKSIIFSDGIYRYSTLGASSFNRCEEVFMVNLDHDRHYRSYAFWLMLVVLFAVLCERTNAVTGSLRPQQSVAQAASESPTAASAIDSACEKILRGDFVGARQIVRKSAAFDSISLRQLGTIIDEYMAIKTQRKRSKNNIYRNQISEFETLRQKAFPEDIDDVGKIIAVVSKTLEYSDREQEQALLNDPFVRQTIRQAQLMAAELELKGRWLEAYNICYSNLEQMYKDDEKYSDYANQLLAKADILEFLQDSPCESCRERCAGIEKQTFTKAVDFLDSGYVKIVDYREMTINAINRCKLLAEVMSNSYLKTKNKISDTQYEVFSAALTAMLDEVKRSPAALSKDKFIDVFERVLALSESSLKGLRLPPEFVITQFATGALSALDPYTVIYWPSQAQNFEKQMTNQFTGIGVMFSKKEELPRVINVLPDTPAHHSGLEAGDIIQAVDGTETKQMSPKCVAKSIAGPDGTKVTLTIRREGENETKNVTLRRTNIVIPSIRGWQRTETGRWLYMIDAQNKIGYIRISCFDSRTVGNFEKALSRLEAQGLKGLVLDLRSNPGGLLNSAIEIADKFINEGLITRIQPRFGMPTYLSAHREQTHPDYPIVVLIDRFTASASEILAGVLQEPKYNRATIVGERSYGKGSVQSILNYLGGGAKLKYTTAYYYLPSGQRIESRDPGKKLQRENWGVSPNVKVKLRSDEVRKIAEVQKANESVGKDRLNNAHKVQRFSSRETIDADPQLEIGLLVLKSKMIESGHRLALN
jgi:carboxyl-terminal processing protease